MVQHIQHTAPLHGIRIRRDDSGKVEYRVRDPRRLALVHPLQVCDQCGHVGIVQRELRHQVVQGPAFRVEAFADGPGNGVIGIGVTIGPHALDIGQVEVLEAPGARVKQVPPGDRRYGAKALLGTEAATPMAVDAGRGGPLHAHAALADRIERRARRQFAALENRLADIRCRGAAGLAAEPRQCGDNEAHDERPQGGWSAAHRYGAGRTISPDPGRAWASIETGLSCLGVPGLANIQSPSDGLNETSSITSLSVA